MENKIRSLLKKVSRLGFSVKPKADGHVDPVCGMVASSDMFTAEYDGKTYYFCSPHCKEQFTSNPASYID